jgi:hypothetical protein
MTNAIRAAMRDVQHACPKSPLWTVGPWGAPWFNCDADACFEERFYTGRNATMNAACAHACLCWERDRDKCQLNTHDWMVAHNHYLAWRKLLNLLELAL